MSNRVESAAQFDPRCDIADLRDEIRVGIGIFFVQRSDIKDMDFGAKGGENFGCSEANP